MSIQFYSRIFSKEYPEAKYCALGELSLEIWVPSKGRIFPHGLPFAPHFIWWLFYHLRIFYNREFGILILRDSEGIIKHHSTITPGYFRFPFMHHNDLQIGGIWTHEHERRKGIA